MCTLEFILSFMLFLQAIRHEAFTHMEGEKEFVQIDPNDLYPYLLVNVGSGVSIIKVFVYVCYFFHKVSVLWLLEKLEGQIYAMAFQSIG